MLKKVLLGIGFVIAALAIAVQMQPSTFRVERSATMAAPSDVVFAQVNDFHRWAAWSPWDKMDPAMKRTYEGPSSGVGAAYSWVGNDKVGEGKMTLTEATPSLHIGVKLDFLKPMQMTNKVDFTFKPDGAGTSVTWAMSGENNFMGKAFALFMNMDKMVGGDFEKGLAGMKEQAEAEAKKRQEAQTAAALPMPAAAAAIPAAKAPGPAPATAHR